MALILHALVALAGDLVPFTAGYPNDPYASVITKAKVVVGVYGAYDLLAQWQHDQLARPRDLPNQISVTKSPQ